jgi:hypothetical protein
MIPDEDEPLPGPVMVPTTPEEAARLAQAPAVGPDRMKALKDKARAEIEQRLKERRKKRRLLRGGDL